MTDTSTADAQATPTLEEIAAEAQRFYAAAAAGDMDAIVAAYDPGIVWTIGSTGGPWVGRYEGLEAVGAMIAEWLAFFDGTFTQEVVDICASPERTAAIIVERGTKDGHSFENESVWVSRQRDGLIVETTTYDLDPAAALAFWAAVGTP